MFLETMLNLIYPNVCGICDKICKENLCKKCELKLQEHVINNVIVNNNKYFDNLISIFKYEGIVREKIIEYKFGEKAYLYKTFARIMLKSEKAYGILKNYDIIIPVPIHKKRKLQRGYNQTELIAREIAKNINVTLQTNVLIKTKNTEVQSLLTKRQRSQNVKNAYNTRNTERIKDKKIILFDDIYTTGSTVRECSKTLKKAGAKEILVLTVAKD